MDGRLHLTQEAGQPMPMKEATVGLALRTEAVLMAGLIVSRLIAVRLLTTVVAAELPHTAAALAVAGPQVEAASAVTEEVAVASVVAAVVDAPLPEAEVISAEAADSVVAVTQVEAVVAIPAAAVVDTAAVGDTAVIAKKG